MDFIFVPAQSRHAVLDYNIVYYGLNMPDHLPFMITMNIDCSAQITIDNVLTNENVTYESTSNRLRWDHADLHNYYTQCFHDF